MLEDKLQEFRKNQSLIEVARKSITDETFICQIRALSENFVQLTEYNHSGEYDGISIIYIEHISDLLWDSKVLEAIEKLAKKKTHFEVPEINLISFETIIKDITEQYKTIEISKEFIGEGGQFGEVINLDKEWICLNEFSPKTSLNRYKSILKLEHITKIATDSLYLKDLNRLYLS